MVALSRLLRTAPSQRRRVIAGTSVAAAAILLFVVAQLHAPSARRLEEPVRAAGEAALADSAHAISVVAPRERAAVEPSRVVFIWRRGESGGMYRLTLTDESGSERWTGDTSDTTVALPGDVSLQRGRIYFWYVAALQANGRSVSSGLHQFVARP